MYIYMVMCNSCKMPERNHQCTVVTLVVALSMICYSEGAGNLARGKTATQSSAYTSGKYEYPAGNALNGVYTDFTHTLDTGIKWWRVDLGDRYSIAQIKIFNRAQDCCQYRLAKITILTSSVDTPVDPSLTSAYWTARDYREEAYPVEANIDFKPASIVRHVAVYSENDKGLALAEVEVYGARNLACGKTATQSSTATDIHGVSFPAGNAVNCIYTDFTLTLSSGIKWWKVDLGGRYSIAQIKIFNRADCCRYRLAKIAILTSSVDTPVDPSLTSADWTERDYREEAYPVEANIDFEPASIARHVAVYSKNYEDLALTEVEVYEPDNLAYNKPARQSDTVMDASNAVNGIYTDFSQTQPDGIKWWTVDIQVKCSIGRIELYNTTGVYDSISQLFILTSNAETPENPSLSSAEWKVRSSQGGIIEFTSPTEGRHVSVFSDRTGVALTLSEVVVYEYNYASTKTTDQSSMNGSAVDAEKAVDGSLGTWSGTDIEVNSWWKVDLGQRILLKSINVYVRNGWCSDTVQECSTRLSDVYFLTNKDSTNAVPAQNSNGWTTCYQSSTSLGDSYVVQCTGSLPALTRQLAIRSAADTRVELREVQVHGHELAQLSEDLDGNTESSTYTSITVSFIQWNQLMIGDAHPVDYVVEVVGTSSSNITNHEPTSDRVQVALNGLNPGQEYTITVRCRADDLEFCPGDAYTFVTSTASCTAPATPELMHNKTEVSHNQRQMYQYTYSWNEVAANCIGTVTYRYSVQGGIEQSNTSWSVTFNIDGYEAYEFTVRSENTAGLTSTATTSEQASLLAPQFGNSQFNVRGISSECLALSWETPEFPGGSEQMYQYRCVGEEWIEAGTDKAAQSCGHQTSVCDNITCTLVALNGQLRSRELSAVGRTLPAELQEPVEPYSSKAQVTGMAIAIGVLAVANVVQAVLLVKKQRSDVNATTRNCSSCEGVELPETGIGRRSTRQMDSSAPADYAVSPDSDYDIVAAEVDTPNTYEVLAKQDPASDHVYEPFKA